MNCPNPRCKKPTFKKMKENTQTYYYYCSTCRYETQKITISNDSYEEKLTIQQKEEENIFFY